MKSQYLTRSINSAALLALTLFFACAVTTVSAEAMTGNALAFKTDRLAKAALIEVAQFANRHARSGHHAHHSEAAAAHRAMLKEAQAIYQSCRDAHHSRAECAQARRAFITSNGETASNVETTSSDASTTVTDDIPQ